MLCRLHPILKVIYFGGIFMKKIVFFLVVFVSFGICVNAQNFQSINYNDGKVIAFLEDYGISNNTLLVIQNISQQNVIVNYGFVSKSSSSTTVTTRYDEITLKPRQRFERLSWYTLGDVISFAIVNVSIQQNPSSSIRPPQNVTPPSHNNPSTRQPVTVPLWAQGTWGRGDYVIRITSSQIILPSGYSANCNSADENRIFFGNSYYNVRKTNTSNQISFNIYSNNSWGEPIILNAR
jgi:hypothetical protein